MVRILGIDPGLNYTGWGIIDVVNSSLKFIDCGIITPPAKLPISERLGYIYKFLTKEVIQYYSPEVVSLEETFVNKNPASALKLGYARGVVLMVPSLYDLQVHEYAATVVKKAVTGFGHADKDQVKKMVQMVLPSVKKLELDSKGDTIKDDAIDALAIALCHAYHKGL